MAFQSVRVGARRERANRRVWAEFLQAVSWGLAAGNDLPGAWNQAVQWTEIPQVFLPQFLWEKDFHAYLITLPWGLPTGVLRSWFPLLAEHYRGGGPLGMIVETMGQCLSQEWESDWEGYRQSMPERVNLLALAVCFPPCMLLIFAPLLCALSLGWG